MTSYKNLYDNIPEKETLFGPGKETQFGPEKETQFGPGKETLFGPGKETLFGPGKETHSKLIFLPSQTGTLLNAYKDPLFLSKYWHTIIMCSSFVLAYFYKLWPFWFVGGYFLLKSSLYWAIAMAANERAKMTLYSYTFYMPWFKSHQREFWIALWSVFSKMYDLISTEDCPPPLPVLQRSDTMCYGDMMMSPSLGCIDNSKYNQLRTNRYNMYFIIVSLCIIAILSFIMYCVW